MIEAKDIMKVNHHEVQTYFGCWHIMSFMGMIGISVNYPHKAYNRLSTLENSSLECQLHRAAWD